MVDAGWGRYWPLALALATGACAGNNAVLPPPAPVSAVRVDFTALESKLKRNTTNQLQVHALLGAPHAVGVAVEASGARYEEWLYYVAGTNGSARAASSTIEIKFDRQGVVRGYRWVEPKTP